MLVHVAVVVLLLSIGFSLPQPQEEGGMAVMLGDAPQAGGESASTLVEVDVLPEAAEEVVPQPSPEVPEDNLLTQDQEESLTVSPEQEEQRREEEARRQAEERAARERREAEEAARRRVAGAFGKGAQMDDASEAKDAGRRGSPQGNADDGTPAGAGGYGTFSLDGRSIGSGGLPRPVYNVQDEGRVVVTITVNPAGYVIATSINPQTNTVNPALRKAAEDAARKARFNAVEGVDNQMGTITYYFNLK